MFGGPQLITTIILQMDYFGIPQHPSNGNFGYSSTTEGSKMNITCNEGFSLQADEVDFVCTNCSCMVS